MATTPSEIGARAELAIAAALARAGIRWAADYELRVPPAADLPTQGTELAVGEAREPGVA